MGGKLLVALDLGGDRGRCLVADADSGRTSTAFRPWKFERNPGLPTASEIDPAQIWSLLGECVREALGRIEARPARVVGVAATSMRHASVLLDADGRELLITTNRDARGLDDSLELAAEFGEELHRRTGHWPNPVQPACRLRWLAREDPDRWKRAAVHLSLSDWLAYRLCGELASDPSQAGETLLFDLARRDWAWDLVDRLEIPRTLLPSIREAGSCLGTLRREAAVDLGLPAGIPVAVGGSDAQCGLLGAGVVDAGALGVIAGTTAPIQLVTAAPILDAEARLWSSPHLIPERWVIESNGGAMGTALDWVAGLLYPGTTHPVLRFFSEAASSLPGASGMISTLGAEVMDARRFGLPIGNLTVSYMSAADDPERRRHLTRSVAEGFAYGLRANVEQVEASAGVPASAVRMTGGLSRNAFFTQLFCDVLGRPVAIAATPQATALGAAICAGVAAGVFESLADGAAKIAHTARTHRPGPDSATHAELYPAWNGLRLAQHEADTAAAGLALRGMRSQPTAAPGRAPRAFRPRILVTAELDEAGLAVSTPDAVVAAEPASASADSPARDVRHQIVTVVNELYAAELITATGGNVSARADTPGEVWITPSQLFKGDLRPEILVRIGMDGNALDPDARSPSSEALVHAAVLAAKPEANAVIHCHAAHATVLVNTGLPFLPISTEAAFFADIGRIPFVMPGTRELADAVVEAMGDGWAVLMGNHGLLVAGRSLRRAADMAEIIERTAEVIVKCYAVGREPSVLPPETVKMLAKMGDLMA